VRTSQWEWFGPNKIASKYQHRSATAPPVQSDSSTRVNYWKVMDVCSSTQWIIIATCHTQTDRQTGEDKVKQTSSWAGSSESIVFCLNCTKRQRNTVEINSVSHSVTSSFTSTVLLLLLSLLLFSSNTSSSLQVENCAKLVFLKFCFKISLLLLLKHSDKSQQWNDNKRRLQTETRRWMSEAAIKTSRDVLLTGLVTGFLQAVQYIAQLQQTQTH